MELGAALRFLDKHPWLALATGIGLSLVSVGRIRRARRLRREERMQARMLRGGTKVPGRKSLQRSPT